MQGGEKAHEDCVNDDVHLDQVLDESDRDDDVHRVVDWVLAKKVRLQS